MYGVPAVRFPKKSKNLLAKSLSVFMRWNSVNSRGGHTKTENVLNVFNLHRALTQSKLLALR
jgi:hypothetical protein